MAEKVKIVELDIDEKAFLKAAENTKIAIDKIVLSQKKLEAQGKKNSQEFIKNEANLKKLSAEFLNQKKAIIALESPYTRLSNKLIRSRKEAKDLAAEFGVNSVQAQKAADKIRVLDNRLKKIDNSLGQNQRSVGKYSQALKGATAQFTKAALVASGFLAGIAAIGRGIRDAIGRIRQFDKTMVGLSAILNESREDLAILEQTIIDVAGASTKTSTEVADLATTLITLGKSKEEVIQLLKPVNDLSIALDATSQEAGELLVQTLNAFGKSSDSAQEYADIIAKMRTSTALDFERIKDALGFLAPTAKAVGLSFENTGAILGVLVDNGIKAARAGRLMSTSFVKLGTAGITLDEALSEINNSQDKLVTAGKLFGKQSASLGLILADNTDKTAALTKEFENSAGTLDQLTKKQLESLDAKLKILDSTWEKFILNVENGEGALSGFFATLIEGTANMITAIDNVSTVSDGFFDFFANLLKSNTLTGSAIIATEALIIKEGNKRKILSKELIDILEEENRRSGIKLDRQAALISLEGQNSKQIQTTITALKNKQKAEEDAAKSQEESKKIISEKEQENLKSKREQEKKDLATFEQDKIDLLNEIEISKAETQRQKDEIKAEQKLEKDLLELENLEITQLQKDELEQLLLTNHIATLKEIRDEAREEQDKTEEAQRQKNLKAQKQFNKEDIKLDKTVANAKKGISSALQGALGKILGDGLASRLLSIILGAKAEIAAVNISTAAAQARNLAAATAVGLPGNLVTIPAATVQNVGLGVKAKVATTRILTAAAISAASSAFYEGGQVPTGTGGTITGSNIPTQQGGDNILATVKSGEVILNDEQQARAGGSAFFKSIGVPGFQTGGQAGVTSNVTNVGQQQSLNIEALSTAIAGKINDIKIVAIEQEITDAQNIQTEIVDGANI